MSSSSTLPFSDAKTCREWLATLPLSNATQVQASLVQTLEAFNAAPFDALERLKSLEYMRERVGFLTQQHLQRVADRPLPLSREEFAAMLEQLLLSQAMEEGYRKALDAAIDPGSSLASYRGFILQRVMRYVTLQMMMHAYSHRAVPEALWGKLHANFRMAEALKVHLDLVKDSLEGYEGVSTATNVYVEALLMGAAKLSTLDAPRMVWTTDFIRRFAGKVTVSREVAEGTWPLLKVDLSKHAGAAHQILSPEGDSLRYLDLSSLAKSIRKRIQGLQANETVTSLLLPRDLPARDAFSMLQHLFRVWCEPPIAASGTRMPRASEAHVALGFVDLYTLVAQRPFEAPRAAGQFSRQDEIDIMRKGTMGDTGTTTTLSALRVTTDAWQVRDESDQELTLVRPASLGQRRLWMRQLVHVREGNAATGRLAVIDELLEDGGNELRVTLRRLKGEPRAMVARAASGASERPQSFGPIFLLPSTGGDHASVVAQRGALKPSATLEVASPEAHQLTVGMLLETGRDFERYLVQGQ